MKPFSVKLQITIFNTILIGFLVILVFLYLVSISDSLIESASIEQLEAIINDNSNEIQYSDGHIYVDDVDFYKKNVTTLLYGVDGSLLYGSAGMLPILESPNTDGAIISELFQGNEYYIYDRYLSFHDGAALWMRGIIPLEEMDNAIASIFHIALIALPFFILITTIGCYYITRHAFRPIEHMIETAHSIANHNDLSLRVPLPTGSDEIHKLGSTFNEMLARIEDSFQMERQFSSDVSHELRTPTAVILAQCEYALLEDTSSQEQEESLEVIKRQSLKMQHMITTLLNLTRLDRGLEQLHFTNCNMSELVQIVCEEQAYLAPDGMTLTYTIEPNLTLQADHTMMIRMLSNLIENGYHYGVENGIVAVTLSTLPNQGIVLTISDNGIGIAEEEQPKIFNRFYQVNPARSNLQTGSMGLGLSMVSQIVTLHKGTISVESQLGVGTTFKILFKQQIL